MDDTPPVSPPPGSSGAAGTLPPDPRGEARVPSDRADDLIFAPPLLLAVLVITFAGAASLRVPIHFVARPVEWLLFVGLVGVFYWWRPPVTRLRAAFIALAGLSGWLVVVAYSARLLPAPGDLLSLHPDNWSYQAMSDYLDHYRRGRVDGMPMIDEFGAHLRDARFASAGLMAFLEALPALNDVATAHLLFLVLCTTAHFFSVLAFTRALILRENWWIPCLGAFLATAGGWLSHAVELGNNDNLIFVSLSPAFLALLCRKHLVPTFRVPVVVAASCLAAAMFYAYPEGTVLLGILAAPLAVAVVWPRGGKQANGTRYAEILAIGVVAVVLTAPYLRTFILFVQSQVSAGLVSGVVRPGEGTLPGLVDARLLPALFALGDESAGILYRYADNIVPVGLSFLLVFGVRRLTSKQSWYAWVALPFAGLFYWQSVVKHYDYGSYKVLICSEWWIYPAIAAGLWSIFDRLKWTLWWRVSLAALLLFGIGLQKYENRVVAPPLTSANRVKAWGELPTIRFVIGDAPVLLALDEEIDHLWATYYLRDRPLATWQQKGYLAMPHIAPYLARGISPPPADCQYMLVSGTKADALWHNSRFSLVRRQSLFIAAVENPPNGVETLDKERFLWLGTHPATFAVVASQAGDYELDATSFGIGPSAPNKLAVTVEVTDAAEAHTVIVTAASHSLPLILAQGENAIHLRCTETPDSGAHNGDPRELMLGIKGPSVNLPVSASSGDR